MDRAAAEGSVMLAAINTGGLEALLKDNLVELALLFIGVLLLFNSRKKDHAATANILGGVIIGLGVVAVGAGGYATQLGSALLGLVWT